MAQFFILFPCNPLTVFCNYLIYKPFSTHKKKILKIKFFGSKLQLNNNRAFFVLSIYNCTIIIFYLPIYYIWKQNIFSRFFKVFACVFQFQSIVFLIFGKIELILQYFKIIPIYRSLGDLYCCTVGKRVFLLSLLANHKLITVLGTSFSGELRDKGHNNLLASSIVSKRYKLIQI